eukprot:scaffold11122_cov81-Alexandrium_tamarense.AAC.1
MLDFMERDVVVVVDNGVAGADASDNVCAARDGTNENASVGWTMKDRVIARSRLTNAECCHTETPTTGGVGVAQRERERERGV